MPPIVAFILCTGFVIFLLRLDRKQAPGVSRVLWLPTIWMLLIAGKPLAAWFGSGGDESDAGSPMDRNFLCFLLLVGMVVLFRRNVNWGGLFRQHKWLTVLICYMFVSILWSEIPFASFKRWIRELVAFVMALVILTDKNPRESVETLFRRTIYILIPYSLLLIKYYPHLGVAFSRWSGELMWVGVTLQKNGLGRLCLIAAFFLIWHLVRMHQKRPAKPIKYEVPCAVVLLGLTAWLLKGPSIWGASATAIASLGSGLALFALLLWMKNRGMLLRRRVCTAGLLCIIALGTLQPLTSGRLVALFTSLLGRDSTLTGRTEIWAGLLPDVSAAPVLGAGCGGFWTEKNINQHQISEAHNGYLEVLLHYGAAGLFLVTGFLVACCRNAWLALKRDYAWGAFCLCYMMMSAIHNISESSFDSLTRQTMAAVLFLGFPFRTVKAPEREASFADAGCLRPS